MEGDTVKFFFVHDTAAARSSWPTTASWTGTGLARAASSTWRELGVGASASATRPVAFLVTSFTVVRRATSSSRPVSRCGLR